MNPCPGINYTDQLGKVLVCNDVHLIVLSLSIPLVLSNGVVKTISGVTLAPGMASHNINHPYREIDANKFVVNMLTSTPQFSRHWHGQ